MYDFCDFFIVAGVVLVVLIFLFFVNIIYNKCFCKVEAKKVCLKKQTEKIELTEIIVAERIEEEEKKLKEKINQEIWDACVEERFNILKEHLFSWAAILGKEDEYETTEIERYKEKIEKFFCDIDDFHYHLIVDNSNILSIITSFFMSTDVFYDKLVEDLKPENLNKD
jgi:hypothetical protein